MCASRQDLNREHATLVTDWALPQLRADEFFITLTIILGTFEGRWFRRLHVQKLSTVRQFLLSVPVGQETVSSGCADLQNPAGLSAFPFNRLYLETLGLLRDR